MSTVRRTVRSLPEAVSRLERGLSRRCYFRSGHLLDEWGARLMTAQRLSADKVRSASELPRLPELSNGSAAETAKVMS